MALSSVFRRGRRRQPPAAAAAQPPQAPQLPYNVLAAIASKADRRTQARMRVMDRTTYADPLMRVRNPPKGKGYLYGTGQLQKLYNEMPRRVQSLVFKTSLRTNFPTRQSVKHVYAKAFFMVRAEYVKAVKTNRLMSQKARDEFWQILSEVPGARVPYAVPPEPERFMTEYLKLMDAWLKSVLSDPELARPLSAKNQSNLRNWRQGGKENRRIDFMFAVDNPEAQAERRAHRIATRAARRLARG